MKFEVQAVNTAGFWYAMVLVDGKVVYSGKAGHTKRGNAINEGQEMVDEGLIKG